MSLLYRIFNVYLGVPTALLGILTSFLSLSLFWKDSTTFLGTRILLFSVSVTDIGYLSLHSFYHLTEDLVPNSFSTQLTILLAIAFYGLNVFEMARNWLLVVVALERLLFFLRPNDFQQWWTPSVIGGAEVTVIVSVLLYYQVCTSAIMITVENGVSAVANYFSIITSTSNFFVYILQSQRYRRRLVHMLHLQQYRWFRTHGNGDVE
ncbi:unnamed protein product [Hydatigera taeniaeformis]|uniref:G protein-coupled receptor n=1 Tax=Hydatigena taeniaeformis TaxID=6205 RepID=A0A0R3X3F7_HYDTA|nr:unnamed protein product [Hydatigera taeniaeformis]